MIYALATSTVRAAVTAGQVGVVEYSGAAEMKLIHTTTQRSLMAATKAVSVHSRQAASLNATEMRQP